MAMRRPRIKASANLMLSSKRKSKSTQPENKVDNKSADVKVSEHVEINKAVDANTEVSTTVTAEANDLVDKQQNENTSTAVEAVVETFETESESTVKEDVQTNIDTNATATSTKIADNIIEKVIPQPDVDHAPPPPPQTTAASNDILITTPTKTESENTASEITLTTTNDQNAEEEGKSSFKCPPKVEYNRSNSHTNYNSSDDVFQSDIEENVIQIDLQKTSNGYPMSPSKMQQPRQRIRPTPIFGQRRNSFVGSSPSPHTTDDVTTAVTTSAATVASAPSDFVVPTHRRERHYSASQISGSTPFPVAIHHSTHKYTPSMGGGRIRTESGCSAFSDSYAPSAKSRKTDDHNPRTYSRRDFEARFTNGVPDKTTLKMFDLIYYNPITNPMEQKSNMGIDVKREGNDETKVATATTTTGDEKPITNVDKIDATEKSAAMPVPQLKLNANGELILDDKSLEIETTAEQEARKVLANSSLIFMDENTGMNGFYKRQKRTKEWLPDETIKFYRCLQTVGTDFSLMCQLFPKRTRRDLKLKFKKEERVNGALINKALLYPKIFNIEELKEQLETEEKEREEAERKWKEIKARESQKIKKVQVNGSIAARVLQNGDDVYQNENVIKQKMSKRAIKLSNKSTNKSVKQNDDDGESKKTKTTKKLDTADTAKPKAAKRRRRAKECDTVKMNNLTDTSATIKVEGIKPEKNAYTPNEELTTYTRELEYEINELLHSDFAPADAMNNQQAIMEVEFATDGDDEDNEGGNDEQYVPIANTNGKTTLTNLDDGSMITVISGGDDETSSAAPSQAMKTEPTSATTTTATSSSLTSSIYDIDEKDIQQVLTDLAEGNLVLVSSLDPETDKVLNEIYMLNKSTGELYENPLDIPDVIVQCILSVMS